MLDGNVNQSLSGFAQIVVDIVLAKIIFKNMLYFHGVLPRELWGWDFFVLKNFFEGDWRFFILWGVQIGDLPK